MDAVIGKSEYSQDSSIGWQWLPRIPEPAILNLFQWTYPVREIWVIKVWKTLYIQLRSLGFYFWSTGTIETMHTYYNIFMTSCTYVINIPWISPKIRFRLFSKLVTWVNCYNSFRLLMSSIILQASAVRVNMCMNLMSDVRLQIDPWLSSCKHTFSSRLCMW